MVNHYEVLGLPRTASANDIRTAYRKIAAKHHPDRSKDPKSVDRFKQATEAFEVLGDPARRKEYDAYLGVQIKKAAEAARKANPFGDQTQEVSRPAPSQPRPQPAPQVSITEELSRLSILFSRERHTEAETLARKILDRDSRQPMAYAILGDLARMAGKTKEATKMYAFAIQMDPKNDLYQRKYDEMLSQIPPVAIDNPEPAKNERRLRASIATALIVVLLAAISVDIFPGKQLLPKSLISSWNGEVLVGLFVAGIAVGACLSTAKLVDRFLSIAVTSLSRPSTLVYYSALAVLNFWFAAAIYAGIALARSSMSYSATRLITSVAAVTLLFAGIVAISSVDPLQTLTWGGNVIYAGAIFGWIVADGWRS